MPILFIPEKDPGKSTSHVPGMLKDVPNILTMMECPGRKAGVPKTDYSTLEMKLQFEQMLVTESVAFSTTFCSRNNTKDNCELIKQGLIEQMEGYTMKLIPSKNNPEAPPKVMFSGKIGGKQDDAMVTMMMLPYWRQKFLEDYQFQPYQEFKMKVAMKRNLQVTRY